LPCKIVKRESTVGIGGFQNFDASLGTPKLVDQRLVYMTPEWKGAFLFTTKLADQLGLEEAIAGSPGWSESGGPWVKPSQGMKKVVWREIRVEGGQGESHHRRSATECHEDLHVYVAEILQGRLETRAFRTWQNAGFPVESKRRAA
jgi:hypothetical protein